MKKALFSLVILFVSVFCAVTVYANDYTVSPYRDMIDNYDEAYKAMYEAVADGDDYVDLTQYKITTDDIIKIYGDLYQTSPEFFYLDKQIKYYFNDLGLIHYVTRLYFSYTMNADERKAAVKRYDEEISYIVSQIDVGMTNVEKALWVHDYFAASYEYDNDETVYDAYGLFTERKGVCQAYSLAYAAVMREIGIECYMVISPEMNHSWNIVKLDDEWYHVDLVFDDPTPDRTGRVLHDYFLLNDEEIKNAANPHTGWISRFTSTSEKYKDGIWKNVSSRMVYSGGKWYYIDQNAASLVSRKFSDAESRSTIFTFEEKWYMSENDKRYWIGVFSGVSTFLGNVFINTPSEIAAYNTMTGRVSVFYEAKEGETLYGSNIYKNTLEYYISDSPNSTEHRIEYFEMKDFDAEYTRRQFPFEDVSKLDKNYSAIKYVYNHGLFSGVSSNRFAPNHSLTRAMFVTVLGRLCGVDTAMYQGTVYSDVKAGYWFSPYVEWASEKNLVNGMGNGKFAPTDVITREQMYKIAAECGSMFGFGETDTGGTVIEYEDSSLISNWAVDGIKYCIKNRILEPGNEQTKLEPQAPSTRGEAAEVIYKLASVVHSSNTMEG